MTRETKFGLLLVVTLTTVFGVLVYKKLHHPNALVAGTSTEDSPEGSTDEVSPSAIANADSTGFAGPGSVIASPTPLASPTPNSSARLSPTPLNSTPLNSTKVADSTPPLKTGPTNPSLKSTQRTTVASPTRTASLDSGAPFSVVDTPPAATPQSTKPSLPTELGDDPFFSPIPADKTASTSAPASKTDFDAAPAMAANDNADPFAPTPAMNTGKTNEAVTEDPFGPPVANTSAAPTSKPSLPTEADPFAAAPETVPPRDATTSASPPLSSPAAASAPDPFEMTPPSATASGEKSSSRSQDFSEEPVSTPAGNASATKPSPVVEPKAEEDPFGTPPATMANPRESGSSSPDPFAPTLEEPPTSQPSPAPAPAKTAVPVAAPQPAGLPIETTDPFQEPPKAPSKGNTSVPLPTMVPEEPKSDAGSSPSRSQPSDPNSFDPNPPTPVKAREPARTSLPVTADDPFSQPAPTPAPSSLRAKVIGESRPAKDALNVNDQQLGGFRPVRVMGAEASSTTVIQPSPVPTRALPTEKPSADSVEFPIAVPQGSNYPGSNYAGSTRSMDGRAVRTPAATSGDRPNEYTVQEADNFWTISKRVYGTGRYFQALAQHNAAVVPNPQRMRAGLIVSTPPAEQLETLYASVIPVAAPATDTPTTPEMARPATQPISEPVGFHVDSRGQPLYRVGPKDTLSDISKQHLGRASRWIQIYELNRETLKDGHNLKIGSVLKLPADASGVRMVDTERVNR